MLSKCSIYIDDQLETYILQDKTIIYRYINNYINEPTHNNTDGLDTSIIDNTTIKNNVVI